MWARHGRLRTSQTAALLMVCSLLMSWLGIPVYRVLPLGNRFPGVVK